MSEIEYEWEVLPHAPGANSMQVLFTPIDEPNLRSVVMAMPFPPEGADLEDYVESNSPVFIWNEERVKRTPIPAGAKGRKGMRGGKPIQTPVKKKEPVVEPPAPQPDLIVEAFKV